MRTTDVTVIILHPDAGADAGPLTRALAEARSRLATRHAALAERAGAETIRVVAGPPDGLPFGARLRTLVHDVGPGGLVVMGSGAIPLATLADHRAFVAAAAGDRPAALANNRYSADVVAIACAREALHGLPDLPSDNELPRWLAETARIRVDDLGHRWRLSLDIDGPLDLVLLGAAWPSALSAAERSPVGERLVQLRALAADPAAELIVAGRTSAATLRWLERSTASRTRAIVEERGLRTSEGRPAQRPPASILGALLERDGPASLGDHLARLGEGALIDSRVLLANRLGPDEAAWPAAEDRFASDLLLPDRIEDRWLRELTGAAAGAPIPVLLGGHSLVGPGVRLALKGQPRASEPWN